jgi:hypothetical protein
LVHNLSTLRFTSPWHILPALGFLRPANRITYPFALRLLGCSPCCLLLISLRLPLLLLKLTGLTLGVAVTLGRLT